MNTLGPLYHWSPRDRLDSIRKAGLTPGNRNIQGPAFHNMVDGTDGEFVQPMVCFSPDPATAWAYSHGCWKSTGVFDLWMVEIEPVDEVHVLPSWGPTLHEIRVANPIPPKRLHWIGERTTTEERIAA